MPFLRTLGKQLTGDLERIARPTKPVDLTYDEINQHLKKKYMPKTNVWNVRFKCNGEELQRNLIIEFLGGLEESSLREAILVGSRGDLAPKFTELSAVVDAARNILEEMLRAAV